MKKKILSILLCSVLLCFAMSSSAIAHEELSTVKHSAEKTQWDIFEAGYETPSGLSLPYHNSGSGIMIKTDPELLTKTCFTNISSCITHAVNAWRTSTFNNSAIFANKISEVFDSYSLTSADKTNEKTLVKVYSEYDSSGDYWGCAVINVSPATYYTATDSGTHLKTCRIRLNEATLGTTSTANRQIYQKYTLTHELGHVIGLADLSSGDFQDNAYSNYLMGYNNWTLLYPTTTDMKGAAAISGNHTTHTNYYYNYRNNTYHEKRCGLCDGYVLETHTVSNGKCTKCNRTIN